MFLQPSGEDIDVGIAEASTPEEPLDPEAPLPPRKKRWPAKYADMLPLSARPLPNMPHMPVKMTKHQREAAAAVARAEAAALNPTPPSDISTTRRGAAAQHSVDHDRA